MQSVLFVCTANQCRSPMAAAFFEGRLAEEGLSEAWRVESAGTWAQHGKPAMRQVRSVMHGLGFDLEGHRSRRVTDALLRNFALILVMETGQQEALQAEFPEVVDRIHMLSSLVGPAYDVADPDFTSPESVHALAMEINELLERGFERIVELSRRGKIPSE